MSTQILSTGKQLAAGSIDVPLHRRPSHHDLRPSMLPTANCPVTAAASEDIAQGQWSSDRDAAASSRGFASQLELLGRQLFSVSGDSCFQQRVDLGFSDCAAS
jgi:hypothetical protein